MDPAIEAALRMARGDTELLFGRGAGSSSDEDSRPADGTQSTDDSDDSDSEPLPPKRRKNITAPSATDIAAPTFGSPEPEQLLDIALLAPPGPPPRQPPRTSVSAPPHPGKKRIGRPPKDPNAVAGKSRQRHKKPAPPRNTPTTPAPVPAPAASAAAAPTAAEVAASAAAAASARELQREYDDWLALISPSIADYISADLAATMTFEARAESARSPGNLVDCLVGVVVGTLTSPKYPGKLGLIQQPASVVRRAARRVMGGYIPPLIEGRLDAVLRSAIARVCIECGGPTAPLATVFPNEGPEGTEDSCGVFLCDDCAAVCTVELGTLDGWQRLYVPSFTGLSPTGAPIPVCLRRHVDDLTAEVARCGGLMACIRANGASAAAKRGGASDGGGSDVLAGLDRRKRKYEAMNGLSRRLPAAAAAAAPAGTVRAELGCMKEYLGQWAVDAIDGLCCVMGKDFRVAITGLTQRFADARGSETTKVPKPHHKTPLSVAAGRAKVMNRFTSQQCVQRLGRIAKRWLLLEREMGIRCPTVAGMLETRTWVFRSKQSAKINATAYRDWLLATSDDVGDDSTIPPPLIDALAKMAKMTDCAMLLDSNRTARQAAILTALINPDMALRMPLLAEPASAVELMDAFDNPD